MPHYIIIYYIRNQCNRHRFHKKSHGGLVPCSPLSHTADRSSGLLAMHCCLYSDHWLGRERAPMSFGYSGSRTADGSSLGAAAFHPFRRLPITQHVQSMITHYHPIGRETTATCVAQSFVCLFWSVHSASRLWTPPARQPMDRLVWFVDSMRWC